MKIIETYLDQLCKVAKSSGLLTANRPTLNLMLLEAGSKKMSEVFVTLITDAEGGMSFLCLIILEF